MNPRLITLEEKRTVMHCEACGLAAPMRPWPKGWVGCGRSRHFVCDETVLGTVSAYWCPAHSNGYMRVKNPIDREIRELREQLRRDRDGDSQVRYSARREGLVPIVKINQQ